MSHNIGLRFSVMAVAAVGVFGAVMPVSAQALGPVDLGMFELSHILKLSDTDPRVIAVRLVNASLELAGIVMLVMVVLGGFRFMLSMGNQIKINAAVGTIRNAIIGLIIILSAWSAAKFVLEALIQATAGNSSA